VSKSNERKPITFDYIAAAMLSYVIIYFWIELNSFQEIHWVAAWTIFYIGGLLPSYIVCRRTSRNQLGVGLKSAAASWLFVVVNLSLFTQNSTASFFVLLLILFLLGGITSAYITMKQRLKPKTTENLTKI
jgi:phosphatidylserine synthase